MGKGGGATREKQDGGCSGGGDGRGSVIPANESQAPFVLKRQFFSALKACCGFTSYEEPRESQKGEQAASGSGDGFTVVVSETIPI